MLGYVSLMRLVYIDALPDLADCILPLTSSAMSSIWPCFAKVNRDMKEQVPVKDSASVKEGFNHPDAVAINPASGESPGGLSLEEGRLCDSAFT